jgi:hypothetical protein
MTRLLNALGGNYSTHSEGEREKLKEFFQEFPALPQALR